ARVLVSDRPRARRDPPRSDGGPEARHRMGLRHAGQRDRHHRVRRLRSADGSHRGLRVRRDADRALGRVPGREARVGAPDPVGVTGRIRRALLAATALAAGCASRPPSLAIDSPASVAGTWHGRMSGPLGNAPVLMTIQDDGAYRGMLFVEPTYREFSGAIT